MASLAGSLVFLVIVPGFVAGLVPRWISGWRFQEPLPGMAWFRFAGGLLAALGAIGLLDSFLRFALQGLGTPLPVFPTQRLVVSGLYRHVRNPMYVAVAALILGQALLFGSAGLLAYAAGFWLVCHAFVLAVEEPKLRKTFGTDYEVFRAAVPRWIPRLRAWRPKAVSGA